MERRGEESDSGIRRREAQRDKAERGRREITTPFRYAPSAMPQCSMHNLFYKFKCIYIYIGRQGESPAKLPKNIRLIQNIFLVVLVVLVVQATEESGSRLRILRGPSVPGEYFRAPDTPKGARGEARRGVLTERERARR